MGKQHHIIKKQIIDLDLPPGENGFQIQEEFRTVFLERILPEMERLFDQYAGPDEVLKIDKLEVDFGSIPMDKLNSRLPEAILQAISHSFSGIKTEPSTPTTVSSSQRLAQPQELAPEVTHNSAPSRPASEVAAQVLPLAQNQLTVFRRFLRTGLLGWQFAQAGPSPQALLAHLIEQVPQSLVSLIQQEVNKLMVRKRLAAQFAPGHQIALLKLIFPISSPSPIQMIDWLIQQPESLAKAPQSAIQFRTIGWEKVWEIAASTSDDAIQPQVWVQEWLDKMAPHIAPRPSIDPEKLTPLPLTAQSIIGQILQTNFPQNSLSPPRSQPTSTHTPKGKKQDQPSIPKQEQQITPAPEALSTHPESEAKRKSNPPQQTKLQTESPSSSTHSQQESPPSQPPIKIPKEAETAQLTPGFQAPQWSPAEGEEFYIQNAGLVLVAAFLEPFFQKLTLVTGLQFTNPEVRLKALHLTQYLVTGTETFPDSDLALNKLICGIPLAEPAVIDFPISEAERAEAETLLTALIQYWKILGTISTTDLRTTFLIREGRLSKNRDGWKLKVDRKAFDMLLNELPWGIGIIRLPWMETTVFVDW